MIDDQTQDGDIILVEKRETAENGESVIAMINGERVTLKRFYVEADGSSMHSAAWPPRLNRKSGAKWGVLPLPQPIDSS